jgi:hypothetical protein
LARAGQVEIIIDNPPADDLFDEIVPCDCEADWSGGDHEWYYVSAPASSQRSQFASIREEHRDSATAVSSV